MTLRSLAIATVILTAPAVSSADGLRLSVAGGVGGAATQPCSYQNPNCGEPSLGVGGAAPLLLAGYRATYGRSATRFRVGATASLLYVIGGGGDSSMTVTGAGEIGIEKHGYAFDLIGGFSRIRVEDQGMTDRGYTMMMGFAFSGRIDPTKSWFLRVDGHAAMHGPIAAGFMGAGIEWRPR